MNQEKYDQLVQETKKDFEKRREERRSLELQWRLNMNFLAGNQYSEITPRGDVEESVKDYFWQEREVYNHIAPIVETRIAKLMRVHGKVRVRPISSSGIDVNSARLSTKILSSVEEKNELATLTRSAALWSETCGSVFYKVAWDGEKGKIIGKTKDGFIKEGDITISVVPPFEIYPDSLNAQNIGACRSIIHARAYSVEEILDKYGVEVKGESVNVFTLDSTDSLGGLGYTASITKKIARACDNHAVVIEKYVAPTREYPNGRLIVVAGDKLLYIGELPYKVGVDGAVGYPFARQVSLDEAGGFFGISVIERIIPIQRAYNAVKNRKHEFMNRIAMGVLAVEDGSCDCENLEEEGLSPGKILIYRQGSNPPQMLNAGNVPTDFLYEEKQLLEEMHTVSGVSEIMQYADLSRVTASGSALDMLIRQDESRLANSADSLRQAIREIGRMIIRLYKQFVTTQRLMRVSGLGEEVETISFTSSDMTSDDLVFETENELLDSTSQRREMVFKLLEMGLLTDENGVLTQGMKTKVLDLLGFGTWESAQDKVALNARKAQKENLKVREGGEIEVSEHDDHEIHLSEHKAEIVANGENEKLTEHVKKHREYMTFTVKEEEENGQR